MKLRRWLDEEAKKEGYIPCHRTGSRSTAETLSAEWRDGTRWAFPWARFCSARYSATEIVLCFGDFQLTIHGLNLDHLWDHVCDRSLEEIWELPPDYVPPPTLKSYRVCVLKLDVQDIEEPRPDAGRPPPRASKHNVQLAMEWRA